MVISPKSLLNGRYIIQSVLGNVGPYDVTYLAEDLVAGEDVVIREFFPLNLASRSSDGFNLEVYDAETFSFGLAVYGREAEILSETSLPNLLDTLDTFQENGTIYRVSQHIPGVPLRAFIRHEGKNITEEQIVSMMIPLLDGLAAAHDQYLYHGYLNPQSIFINDDLEPVFLNFQMARTRLAGRCKNRLEPYAFSPYFNVETTDFASWDIYGFGATLFYMLAGHALPAATNSAEQIFVEQAVKHEEAISPSLKRFLLETLSLTSNEASMDVTVLRRRLLECYTQSVYLNSDDFNETLNVDIGTAPTSVSQGGYTTRSEVLVTDHYVSDQTPQTEASRTPQYLQLAVPEREISINDRFIQVISRQQEMIMALGMVLLVSLVFLIVVFMGL